MERLTARDGFGTPYYPYCDNVKGCGGYCAQCNFETKTMDKLAEYEDLEEQGLLLRLPCKVGTTVYIIVGKDISKQSIKRITIDSTGMLEFCTKRRGFQLSDFGKTVFLTQAEAEQKLKEMES